MQLCNYLVSWLGLLLKIKLDFGPRFISDKTWSKCPFLKWFGQFLSYLVKSSWIKNSIHSFIARALCWICCNTCSTSIKVIAHWDRSFYNNLGNLNDVVSPVWDRNLVSVLGTETKVQFQYRFRSQFFFPKPKLFFSIFSHFSPLLGVIKVFISLKINPDLEK